jgi:hypothetical protein
MLFHSLSRDEVCMILGVVVIGVAIVTSFVRFIQRGGTFREWWNGEGIVIWIVAVFAAVALFMA